MGRVLLEDAFEYQTVPFIVKVERKRQFINGKTGECCGVNMYKAPSGMEKIPSSSWKICSCIVGFVRPDYPYTIETRWPEDVSKHFSTVEPLEKPVKSKGLIFTSWDTETIAAQSDIDVQAVADETVSKLKQAYESRTEPKTLH